VLGVATMLQRPIVMAPLPPRATIQRVWEKTMPSNLPASEYGRLAVIKDIQKRYLAEAVALEEGRAARRRAALVEYRPTALPELFGARGQWKEAWLQPGLSDALARAAHGETLAAWPAAPRRAGVAQFRLLGGEFMSNLTEEFTHFKSSGVPFIPPTSSQGGGTTLASMGAEWAARELVAGYLAPLAEAAGLGPGGGAISLDQQHSYIFNLAATNDSQFYEESVEAMNNGERQEGEKGEEGEKDDEGEPSGRLAPGPESQVPAGVDLHWDDAEVTMAVVLENGGVRGGRYVVCFEDIDAPPSDANAIALPGGDPDVEHPDSYQACVCDSLVMQPGVAVLHRGAVMHGWEDVEDGQLTALEVWGVSTRARSKLRHILPENRAHLPYELMARAHAPMPSFEEWSAEWEGREGGAPWYAAEEEEMRRQGITRTVKIDSTVLEGIGKAKQS